LAGTDIGDNAVAAGAGVDVGILIDGPACGIGNIYMDNNISYKMHERD
jgi:hypothetical protein